MNTKQKIYLISGLILILVVFLFFGIIRPFISEIKNASATVGQSREKLLLLERTDPNYLKQIESDYNDINGNLGVVRAGLIDKDKAVDFFVALEEFANSTSNQLQIKATEFPSLTLDVVGDFSNLMKFMGWLEKGKYFLDIESVQIRGVSEGEVAEGFSAGDVKTTLRIKVYTKK